MACLGTSGIGPPQSCQFPRSANDHTYMHRCHGAAEKHQPSPAYTGCHRWPLPFHNTSISTSEYGLISCSMSAHRFNSGGGVWIAIPTC